MSKQISAAELAVITHSLLIHPERLGELDSDEKYQAFMTGLATLICDHCGGEVQMAASNPDAEAWFIGIHGNDSLPPDGGVWKAFDPEGTLFDAMDKAPCFEHGHWYVREEDRALFIVPDDRLGLADTFGPDDEALDALNACYRNLEAKLAPNDPNWFDKVDPDKVARLLDMGLSFVHSWQRRFDTAIGWQVA